MREPLIGHVTRGNIFRDLGFGPVEAEYLRIRSDLAIAIERELRDRGLTQAAAAKLLGVHPPRVSDLLRGKLELFSLETLIEMLTKLGVRVEVKVGGRARRKR